MADDTSKAPVVDSRQPGFDPEVEASHAEAEAAAKKAAAVGDAEGPVPPAPPTYSHRCEACGALYEISMDACAACGSAQHIVELPKATEA